MAACRRCLSFHNSLFLEAPSFLLETSFSRGARSRADLGTGDRTWRRSCDWLALYRFTNPGLSAPYAEWSPLPYLRYDPGTQLSASWEGGDRFPMESAWVCPLFRNNHLSPLLRDSCSRKAAATSLGKTSSNIGSRHQNWSRHTDCTELDLFDHERASALLINKIGRGRILHLEERRRG